MFSIRLLQLSVEVEELLKHRLPSNAAFIVVSPEFVVVPRFLEYAFLQAFKTFGQGKNTAHTLSLEWLCKLAMTKNVSSAVTFTKPEGKTVCLASVNCFESEQEISSKVGKKLKISKKLQREFEKKLAEKYSISKKALEVYKLEDLLVEKAAVENL